MGKMMERGEPKRPTLPGEFDQVWRAIENIQKTLGITDEDALLALSEKGPKNSAENFGADAGVSRTAARGDHRHAETIRLNFTNTVDISAGNLGFHGGLGRTWASPVGRFLVTEEMHGMHLCHVDATWEADLTTTKAPYIDAISPWSTKQPDAALSLELGYIYGDATSVGGFGGAGRPFDKIISLPCPSAAAADTLSVGDDRQWWGGRVSNNSVVRHALTLETGRLVQVQAPWHEQYGFAGYKRASFFTNLTLRHPHEDWDIST